MSYAFYGDDDTELATHKEWMKEIWQRGFPNKSSQNINFSSITIDPLYNEVKLEDRSYEISSNLRSYVNENPSEKDLKKIGIDKQRDLIIYFCQPLLDDASFTVNLGMKFTHRENVYEIMSKSYEQEHYFHHSSYCFILTCTADKLREGV